MPSATMLTPAVYSVTDATSYVSASVSPTANRWLVVDAIARKATAPDDPTISGLSLSFTTEISDTGSGLVRIKRAYAWTGASPGSGAITMDYVNTQIGAGWFIYELSGDVDNADPFVQTVSRLAPGSPTENTVTLAAFASSDNRPIIVSFHNANEVSDPEADYTEIGDVQGGAPNAGIALAYNPTTPDTTPTYSWVTASGVSFAVASEIKVAAGAGGSVVMDPFGMTGFFGS